MEKYFNEKTAKQLTLVAKIKAKAGKAEALKEELLKLMVPTRNEEGSISYHLYFDTEHPETFIFHETWATEELWQKHMGNAPLKTFFAEAGEMIDGEPVIEKWERNDAPNPVIDKNSLVLFAYNTAKPSKEKAWTKILTDLVPLTLAEKGALHYELHINREDPRKFMFHETWQTVESWHDHMEAPHLKALLDIIADYTENGIAVTKAQVID